MGAAHLPLSRAVLLCLASFGIWTKAKDTDQGHVLKVGAGGDMVGPDMPCSRQHVGRPHREAGVRRGARYPHGCCETTYLYIEG